MVAPPPLPPYPPPLDEWRFPPPAVSRRWLWIAIGGGIAGISALVMTVVSMVIMSEHGIPSQVDDPELLSGTVKICEEMSTLVNSSRVNRDDVDERIDAIDEQSDILWNMIQQLESLKTDVRVDDEPFDEWVDDWALLVNARDAYTGELAADPHARFVVPKADGDPINERMDTVVPGCTVPTTLLHPDRGL